MTNKELFNIIIEQLKAGGNYPENLIEYCLPEYNAVEIKKYEFDTTFQISYGGSEGIYMTIYLSGDTGNQTQRTVLGTIKTLLESPEAMRKMAVLGADFIVAATEYVNKHIDVFDFFGTSVSYCNGDKLVTAYKYGFTDETRIKEEIARQKRLRPEINKVIITDMATRNVCEKEV